MVGLKTKLSRETKFKTLLLKFSFIVCGLLSLYIVTETIYVYPYGDANEYILTTEAIYNHGTANVLKSDAQHYIHYLDSNNLELHRAYDINRFIDFYDYFFESGFTFSKDYMHGLGFLTVGKNEKFYAQHFWFYSAICVPARAILEYLNQDIRLCFALTNYALFLFCLYLILFARKVKLKLRLTFGLMYLFTPTFWYLNWPHPDALAGILCFLGCFYYFTSQRKTSLFTFSIASMHFLPLAIISLFIITQILYRDKIKTKLLLKLGVLSFWPILPILFSLYVFETPNIIQKSGFLSWEVVDLKRFVHFFIDPNQGIIRGFPLGLILFVAFLIYDLVKRKKIQTYFLTSTITLMALLFMQMQNWNHGMAIVNRYAVWVTAIIAATLTFRLSLIGRREVFITCSSILLFSQVYVTIQKSNFKTVSWDAYEHSILAKTLLNNWPQLYNPDPTIFSARTAINEHISSTDSVKTYSNPYGKITKFMFQSASTNQLINRGFNETKLRTFIDSKKPYHHWYYINSNQFNYFNYQQENDVFIKENFRTN